MTWPYPCRRAVRERPHPKLYGHRIREATCVICGRWFRLISHGRITCGPACADKGRRIRAGEPVAEVVAP